MINLSFVGVLLLNVATQAFNFPLNSGMYSLNPTRKDIAVNILQKLQAEHKSMVMAEFRKEFDTAQIWCKTHESDDAYFVSFVCKNENSQCIPQNSTEIHYIVLYRRNHEVFTVSGLVRLEPSTSLTTSDVFLMLRKQCDAKGYLQLHELKLWGGGRYPIESWLEDMFSS